ncbi:Uncharacterised protein [Legionella wadsworthii]|uniref:Uncharacterized protein n=1 Tax=Legionella wadsworthii TaxID=28088 RepID=A0A378M0V4_9GAMM|nr:hypothetical protein [Legionella wadsworthii]STY29978.1 Uncharacterised protein [Legionella wadsworthii]
MPVSKECMKLLQNMVDHYGLEGKADKDYGALHHLLKDFLLLVIQHQQNHKDERVIAFLSNSALILEENSCFVAACRKMILDYHQKTHALDSMLDMDLNIHSELDESWGKFHESNPIPSLEPSRFFQELQIAVAKRAQRMVERDVIKSNP